MKNNLKIVIIVLVVIIIGIFVYYYKIKPAPINEGTPIVTEGSIKGCYVAHLAKDIYTLTILSQSSESFEGKLSFKNFEKDSSSGTFKGTYKNEILLGDYSFQSEGTNSVMQVIFKKSGDDFIRGFGSVTVEGNSFTDLNNITYDSSAVFKFSKEECETSLYITTDIKQNVENYLRENISKLSPVKAVLGGTWYVVSDTVDLEKNSGTVTYEDGHIQEIKNFLYITNDKGEIVSLIIVE